MKKIIAKILAFACLFCTMVCCVGCSKKVDDFSVEEHIQRITERIETGKSYWWYPTEETYEDFEVYPLYDKNEELKYFLVEFEPYGFVFISVQDEPLIFTSFLCAHQSMYVLSPDIYGPDNPWTPYVRNENSPPLPSLKEGWSGNGNGDLILDENGEMIIYDKSPYFVTGNINEKKYLLQTDCSYEFIFAVKENGKFINLISGLELDNSEEFDCKNQATMVVRFIADKAFDL